jgi:hypothetical protein
MKKMTYRLKLAENTNISGIRDLLCDKYSITTNNNSGEMYDTLLKLKFELIRSNPKYLFNKKERNREIYTIMDTELGKETQQTRL